MGRPTVEQVADFFREAVEDATGEWIHPNYGQTYAENLLRLFEPETVTTVKEVEALPHGTGLHSPDGGLSEVREGAMGKYLRFTSGMEAPYGWWGRHLPATVIYRPESEDR